MDDKRKTVALDEQLHRRIKILAAQEGITIGALIGKAIEEYEEKQLAG